MRALEPRLGCRVTPLKAHGGDQSALLLRLLDPEGATGNVAWSAGTRDRGSHAFDAGDGVFLYANHCYLVLGLVQHDGEDGETDETEPHVVIRNPHNRSGTTTRDFDQLDALGHGGLNCDHKAASVLVPAREFHRYFLTLSAFHWLVPGDSNPIHFD